ncbi:hypothetical protein [Sphingomonas aerolata]|uniref:hypothetical protein n=1 Tax=Sphingomonas aerolata TaxID=185951 RepID=UPI002FE0F4CE
MVTTFEIRLPTSLAGFAPDQTFYSASAGWLKVRSGCDGWRDGDAITVPDYVFDRAHQVDDELAYRIGAGCAIEREKGGPEAGGVVMLLESPHRDEYDGQSGIAIGPLRNKESRDYLERYLPSLLKVAEGRLGRSLEGLGVNLVNAVQYQTSLQALMTDYGGRLQDGVRTRVWKTIFASGGDGDMLARLDRYDPGIVLAAPTKVVWNAIRREFDGHSRRWPWLRVDSHPSCWKRRVPKIEGRLHPATVRS